MARIDWAQLCELAFLDDRGQICLIGVTTHLPVPSLPIAVRQLMIAARVVNARHGDVVDVSVSILTPRGLLAQPDSQGAMEYAVAGGEYLLITLRDLPLTEEGMYRVLLSVGDDVPAMFEVPVELLFERPRMEVH
jgi:uncharacterized protein DUF6941